MNRPLHAAEPLTVLAPPPGAKRGARERAAEWIAAHRGFWFLLPALATLIVVLLGPIVYSLEASVYGWSLVLPGSENDYVGLSNYIWVLTSPDFWSAAIVTIKYALGAIVVELPLGMLFALLLNQRFPAVGFFRSVMIIPMVLTPSVLGIFWKLYFDTEAGLFNYLLGQLGIPKIDWLGLDFALPSLILLDAWQCVPFFTLIILAGLQSRDDELVEAASIDGAGPLQIFRYLTLPHLTPYILIACAFRLIATMGDFDKIFLLTAGGPGNATTTLSVFAYKLGFSTFEIGRTAAIAWVYLSIVLVVSAPLIFYLNRHAIRDR